MAEDSDFLDLADYTGLLIDNTLTALIRSLESQLQWREQITAIDKMSDEDIYSALSDEDIEEWIAQSSEELIILLEKWGQTQLGDKLDLSGDPDLGPPLIALFFELGLEVPQHLGSDNVIFGEDYAPFVDAIKWHLVSASKARLSMMKDMGLPALVAERVEIKSKMNLVSERVDAGKNIEAKYPYIPQGRQAASPNFEAAQMRKFEPAKPVKVKPMRYQDAARVQLAKPARPHILDKLSDLEYMRSQIPATKTHRVKISAQGQPQSSDNQMVNAEVSIVLRSHFF